MAADRSDVASLGSNQSSLAELLEAMRGPSQDPTDREGRGEKLLGDAQSVQEERRVKLDIGGDRAVGFSSSQNPECHGLDLCGERIELPIALRGVELLSRRGEHIGAQISATAVQFEQHAGETSATLYVAWIENVDGIGNQTLTAVKVSCSPMPGGGG